MRVSLLTQNEAVRPPYSALFGALVWVSEDPRCDDYSGARHHHETQRRQLLRKRPSLESLMELSPNLRHETRLTKIPEGEFE
jgi:hypothetical protein